MKLGKYESALKTISSENMYMRTMTVLMGFGIILCFIFLGGEKVVVVQQPPGLNQSITVGENTGNQAFKERWALSFAVLMGNSTPSNIDFVVHSIEDFFSPEIYQHVKDSIATQVAMLKHEQALVTFTPKSIIYESSSDKVFLNGDQEIRAFSVTPKRKNWTMEFKIGVVNYLPVVTWYDAYEGPPRTKDVRARLKNIQSQRDMK